MVSFDPNNDMTIANKCSRYHGKCLKIARGKVKEDDKYTCPICDYRLKIPRDAARPKIEDLQAWQDEIPGLPFQPEEEDCLDNIVTKATEFRASISSLLNPLMSTPEELSVQRFYLRKIEGADVLLTDETNFLRQELHKWAPVAPEPPKMIDASLSTRKPRPTKQQKLMAQLGITNPDDLPPHLRPKQPGTKKKEKEGGPGSASGDKRQPEQFVPHKPASKGSTGSFTPPGLPHGTPSFSRGPNPSTTATDQGRHPTFSFEAMAATSYASSNSPIFTTAAHHGLPHGLSSHGGVTSPTTAGGNGVDPSLENMFGRPSSSTNSKLDAVRPVSLFQQSTVEDRSDPMDTAENFFGPPAGDDGHDFLPAFGAETSTFEENMGGDAFGDGGL
jgi:histone demethylase JARID1